MHQTLPSIQVGPLVLDPPLLLAPMASLTTPSLRTLCEESGCTLTFTEMVSVAGLLRNVRKVRALLRPSFLGRPFGIQLCGIRPHEMKQASAMAVSAGASVVDLNMGCPARKVLKSGAGAALIRTPDLAARLVEAAMEGAGGKAAVTVKMRSGWDESCSDAVTLARAVARAGASLITVHGRTKSQGFLGPVDLTAIKRVVLAVEVPVLGNGGVKDSASMERMISSTGCAGVMVGRGALGRPWIFEELTASCRGLPLPKEPDLVRCQETMLRHLDLYLEETSDPTRTVLEMRKHLACYSRSVHLGSGFRARLYEITDLDALREHVRSLAQRFHRGITGRSGSPP